MPGRKPKDIAGQKFYRLTAVEYVNDGRWRFACECGGEVTQKASLVHLGNTKSCGCLNREASRVRMTTHGYSSHPLYATWCEMHRRCNDRNSAGYENYGGRGIQVCERWNDFPNFALDMGERPAGTSLDRYPNADGDYEPSNCRWATSIDQNNNKRNSRFIEFRGRRQTLAQWAAELKMSSTGLSSRLKLGWTIEEALTLPRFARPKRTFRHV